MTHHDKNKLAFFFPDARVLSNDEVAALPNDKKKSAASAGSNGVWLEVNCPEGACVGKDGKISLQAAGAADKKGKGLWLNVFCPEDSCLWKSGSELP